MNVEIVDGFNIITAILCEEVRPEPNGKWTLLGTFSGELAVASFPAVVRLGIYLEVHITKRFHGPMFVRLRVDNQDIIHIKGEIESQPGYLSTPVSSLIVTLPQAGLISVDMSDDQKKWTTVLTKGLIAGTFKDGKLTSSTS